MRDKGKEVLCEPHCCDDWCSTVDEVDGECPECGMPTVGGFAAYGCSYSPVDCETCGHASCDGSC